MCFTRHSTCIRSPYHTNIHTHHAWFQRTILLYFHFPFPSFTFHHLKSIVLGACTPNIYGISVITHHAWPYKSHYYCPPPTHPPPPKVMQSTNLKHLWFLLHFLQTSPHSSHSPHFQVFMLCVEKFASNWCASDYFESSLWSTNSGRIEIYLNSHMWGLRQCILYVYMLISLKHMNLKCFEWVFPAHYKEMQSWSNINVFSPFFFNLHFKFWKRKMEVAW